MSDSPDLDRLAADLRASPQRIAAGMKATTRRAGGNIQRTARASAAGGHRVTMKRFGRSIYSKVTAQTATSIQVTVESKHPLGAILEFGTATSGPHPVLGNAFRDEVPVWETFLDDVVGGIL